MMQEEGSGPLATFLHAVPEWLLLVALAFCFATLVIRLWVLEAAADKELPHHRKLLTRLWRFFGAGIAVLAAGSIADLFVRAAEISGQPPLALFSVVPTVVFRTHIGRVWLIRMAALTFFAMVFIAGRKHRDSRKVLMVLLGLGLVISMTESASGHASDAGDLSLAEIVDWFHLLAASIWGGGLLVLSVAVLPELARYGERIAPVNASVARRFSGIAGFAVGVVIATSGYNAWAYVGSFGALWKTPYGWTVVLKILLFSLVMYLGAFNRYVSVPLLQRACYLPGGRGFLERIAVRFFPRYLCTEEKSLIFSRFMWSVKVEAILIVGILLCAALLRHEIPARHHSHMERSHERMLSPHPQPDQHSH